LTDGERTITVTEEEYQLLLKAREALKGHRAAAEKLGEIPGGKRGADFALGAVAGMAAYWLYEELFDEDDDESLDVAPRGVAKGPKGRKRR
jgi:DNA-binding transcriptional LysR family regulator